MPGRTAGGGMAGGGGRLAHMRSSCVAAAAEHSEAARESVFDLQVRHVAGPVYQNQQSAISNQPTAHHAGASTTCPTAGGQSGRGAPDASGVLAQGHNTRARERGKVHHGVHAREVALQVGESVREHEPPCRQASTSVLASRVRAIHRLNCTARGF